MNCLQPVTVILTKHVRCLDTVACSLQYMSLLYGERLATVCCVIHDSSH